MQALSHTSDSKQESHKEIHWPWLHTASGSSPHPTAKRRFSKSRAIGRGNFFSADCKRLDPCIATTQSQKHHYRVGTPPCRPFGFKVKRGHRYRGGFKGEEAKDAWIQEENEDCTEGFCFCCLFHATGMTINLCIPHSPFSDIFLQKSRRRHAPSTGEARPFTMP